MMHSLAELHLIHLAAARARCWSKHVGESWASLLLQGKVRTWQREPPGGQRARHCGRSVRRRRTGSG